MIREARSEDIKPIADVIVSSWQTAYEGIIDPDYPANLKRNKFEIIFKNNIENQVEKIFVFEISGKIAGFISGKLNSSGYDSEVIGLYIHPDYQKNKIGSELLNIIKEYFRKQRCKNMIIWTLLNAKNNQFYRKHGGTIKEKKELQFGSKKYKGIGFVFNL